MVLIGDSDTKKSTWKEVSLVLIVVQTMHQWRFISTTSYSMWLPTLTLRLWCVYLCTRAIIRLRAPCPNNSSRCALMSPYTPNQPSRLIVAEMAVDSSDLHRPVCWAGPLPKGSAKQMQTLQKKCSNAVHDKEWIVVYRRLFKWKLLNDDGKRFFSGWSPFDVW